MSELEKLKQIEHYDPSKLNDKVLLDDHRILHAWWATLLTQGKFKYSKQDIINWHHKVVDEMKKRGFEHHRVSALDDSVNYFTEEKKESNETDNLQGMYLVEPHAVWIFEGKKKEIVKSRAFNECVGKPMILVGRYAYGIITITKIRAINLKEFKARQNIHLVSDEERKAWWPKYNKLFLYEFKFKPFPSPIEYDRPKGIRTFIRDVELHKPISKESRLKILFLGTKGLVDIKSPQHAMHTSTLFSYKGFDLLVDFGLDWRDKIDDIGPNAVLLTHAHPDHAGGLQTITSIPVYLTEDTWKIISNYPIIRPRIIEPKKIIEIGPFTVKAFPVSHSIKAPAVGFIINAGTDRVAYFPDVLSIEDREEALKDVDLYIGDGSAIEKQLVRRKDGEVYGHAQISTQINWLKEAGVKKAVFTHFGEEAIQLPMSVLKQKLKQLGEPEVSVVPAVDNATLEFDSETVSKADTLSLYWERAKPAWRIFELEDLQKIKEFADQKELVVSTKWDGERVQLQKNNGKVVIFSDAPADRTDRMPTQVEELKAMKQDNFILDGEAVMIDETNMEALHRTMTGSLLRGKFDPTERSKLLHIFVFDILRFNGKDVRKISFEERANILSQFNETDHIHPIIPTRDLSKPSRAYIVKVDSPDFPIIVDKLMKG
jgi:phosphoribosyl 1,2-cyclic phosphodiesterase